MSDNLRAALEAKHRQHVHAGKCHGRLAAPKYERMEYLTGPGTYCEGCHNDWPCDTALALATEAEAAHPEPVDGLREAWEAFAGFVYGVAETEVRVYNGTTPDASMTLAGLVEVAQRLLVRYPARAALATPSEVKP